MPDEAGKARRGDNSPFTITYRGLLQSTAAPAAHRGVLFCLYLEQTLHPGFPNKPHNSLSLFFPFFKNICHLGTFSIGVHLELAPGHVYTAWEGIKAVLTCLPKHLLSSYFFLFFPQSNEWKHFPRVLATQEPDIRDLSLCNRLRSTPVYSAKLHLAVISIKAVHSVQQPRQTLKPETSRERYIYSD